MPKAISLSTKALLLLILFFNFTEAYSLEILFSRYSLSSGLSSNFVNCVWQDARGLMWIGTENGLQRFDGSKFSDFYRNSNNKKLPAVPVHQIMGDAKGQMWIRMGNRIGTFNTFNYTFREARIISAKPIPQKADYYLRRDYKGNFLLTVHKLGVYIYNENKHAFEERKDEFFVPSDLGINHSFEDRNTGNYWLSTDKGLALYNYKEKKIYTAADKSWNKELFAEPALLKNVTHLHIDKQRRYWIVSKVNGNPKTFCFDEKTKKFLKDTAGLNYGKGYYEIQNFKESRGILWAYGLHFLKIYDKEDRGFIEFYSSNATYGIKFNKINHIFEDREKNVWLSTDNGVYVANVIFNQARHGTIKKVHHEDAISSAVETFDSHILLGTLGRDIEAIKVSGYIYTPAPALRESIYAGQPANDRSYQMVFDLHEHSLSKTIWLSCEKGKLISYNPLIKRSKFISDPVFEAANITQLTEDKSGNLWFGTEKGKIVKLAFHNIPKRQFITVGRLDAGISKFYFDKLGLLWIATEGKGLFLMDPSSGRILKNFNNTAGKDYSLSDNIIKDVVQYNDSIFYVASGNLDIINVRTRKVRQLSVYDGLPFTSVSSLQIDRFGDLWFSTVGGLCTYNYNRNVFREYDQKDGLVTTTSSDNLLVTSIKLKNKRLLFAGGNSFVSFDPYLVKDKKRPKDITITDFKLFNSPLPVDSILKLKQLELQSNENSITIEFASLDYTHRDKLSYYYMLEGADQSWIKSDGPMSAHYSALTPGTYKFKVKAVNSEGLQTPHITSLPIVINPAAWQTWWFKLIITFIITAIIYSAYRMRLAQMMEVQRIRERVARDLHDDMGSTLSTINILSEMAKIKIKDNIKSTEDYLSKISDNSSRMMEAMDDIVWSIKPSNDSIQKISARMREFAAEILEPKDIDYLFKIDEEIIDLTLNMEARRDLFLIFKEAINNLAKYSEAKNARISFYREHNNLILLIEDDGKGFDLKTAEGGNGLNNMKKRSEKLKGTFKIHSEAFKGTTVHLELALT